MPTHIRFDVEKLDETVNLGVSSNGLLKTAPSSRDAHHDGAAFKTSYSRLALDSRFNSPAPLFES
jgi:hypothetical protein